MFTRLKITQGGITAIFESHELVGLLLGEINGHPKIKSLLDASIEKVNTFIPKQGDFDHYCRKYFSENDFKFVQGKFDNVLLLPMHIEPMGSIGQYFYVTDQLRQWAEHIELDGWWLSIGGQSLYLKNQESKTRFYISDFGFTLDIFDRMKKTVLEMPWLEGASVQNLPLTIFQEALARTDIPQFRNIVRTLPLDRLHDVYPSRTPEQLLSLYNRLLSDDKYANNHCLRLSQEHQFIANLKPLLEKVFSRDLNLMSRLQAAYPSNAKLRTTMLKIYVALEIMKDVNDGKHANFFRPLYAFGDPDSDGATYKEFAAEIESYLSRSQSQPEKLATQLRAIIKNEFIPSDELDFLPNLAAAWFVAEASRNRLAIPTGLMLLDFLENPEWLVGQPNAIKMLYTWRNVFLHPKEGSEDELKDLYGKPIKWEIKKKKDGSESRTAPIMFFRGTHPMVHLGSAPDSRTNLGNTTPLSRVRQKEGSLILHWLAVLLKKRLPTAVIELTVFDEDINTSYLDTPNYKEIEQLLSQIIEKTKAMKKIESEPRLFLKYRILSEYIIPLLQARCRTLNNVQANLDEFLASASKSAVTPKQQPQNIINPVATPIQTPSFILQLPKSDRFNLYSIIIEACTNAGINLAALGNPIILQSLVVTDLLDNQLTYQEEVTNALHTMIISRTQDIVNIRWVNGLAYLMANQEKVFGQFIFSPPDFVDVKDFLTTSLCTRALESVKESELPTLDVCKALQDGSRLLKIYILWQFSDALWFKERLEFLHNTLRLDTLTHEHRNSIHMRILALLNDVHKWDTIYKKLINREIEKKVYPLYCDNARVLGATTGSLEIEILAKLLKLNISCFISKKRLNAKEIFAVDSNGIQPFYFDKEFKYSDVRKLPLFFLGADKGYAFGEFTSSQQDLRFPTQISSSEDGFIIAYLKDENLVFTNMVNPFISVNTFHNLESFIHSTNVASTSTLGSATTAQQSDTTASALQKSSFGGFKKGFLNIGKKT